MAPITNQALIDTPCGITPLSMISLEEHVLSVAPFTEITEPTISELVRRFYGRARRDPMIGPVFNRAVADWDEHLRKLSDFWSSVMLTTGRYKGNPMSAHLKQSIEPHFFERWLSLWQETTRELFAPEVAALFQLKAERIGESLKLALFYRPGALRSRAG